MSISSSKFTQKKPYQQSFGKIYTAKRQPLAQILFYPKSALIDDYYLDHLHMPNNHQQQKVIKFVGDEQTNIKIILASLDVLNQAQNKIMMAKQKSLILNEFSQILRLFYQKINKIRGQRDSLKLSIETQQRHHFSIVNNFQKDLSKLREEIVCLKKEKQRLIQKLENQSKKKQYFERQHLILLQKQKVSTISSPQNFNPFHVTVQNQTYLSQINQNGPSLLDSQTEDMFQKPIHSTFNSNNYLNVKQSEKWNATVHSNSPQNQRRFTDNKLEEQRQQLDNFLKKYNLRPSQLQGIIEEYSRQVLSNQKKDFQTLQNKQANRLQKKSKIKF